MARFVAGVMAGIVITTLAGAAVGLHAAAEGGDVEAPESVEETPAVAAVPVPTPEPPQGVWDALARCESTSNWHINSGNSFYGGLQFDRQTWLAYGGGVYAPRADLASRAQQIAVAEKLRASRGYQPWPVCSRKLGLR